MPILFWELIEQNNRPAVLRVETSRCEWLNISQLSFTQQKHWCPWCSRYQVIKIYKTWSLNSKTSKKRQAQQPNNSKELLTCPPYSSPTKLLNSFWNASYSFSLPCLSYPHSPTPRTLNSYSSAQPSPSSLNGLILTDAGVFPARRIPGHHLWCDLDSCPTNPQSTCVYT